MANTTVEVREPVPADFSGLRILVVDDTAPNRDLMRSILESVGAEIFDAGNGPEALRIARLQPVDLLILDIRMPDMSGVDLLREIRVQGGPNCQVPAIAFTADDDLETLYPGHGFSGHARKPIVPRDLFETIESVVPTLESALRQGMLGAA